MRGKSFSTLGHAGGVQHHLQLTRVSSLHTQTIIGLYTELQMRGKSFSTLGQAGGVQHHLQLTRVSSLHTQAPIGLSTEQQMEGKSFSTLGSGWQHSASPSAHQGFLPEDTKVWLRYWAAGIGWLLTSIVLPALVLLAASKRHLQSTLPRFPPYRKQKHICINTVYLGVIEKLIPLGC